MRFRVIWMFLLFSYVLPCEASFQVPAAPIELPLPGSDLLLYEDKSGKQTIQEIDLLPDSAFFQRQQKVPNLGFSRSTYWVRVHLSSEILQSRTLFLEYGYPLADKVEFFARDRSGIWQSESAGDRVPAMTRTVRYRNPVFSVELSPGDTTVYLRVQSDGSLQFPLILRDSRSFEDHKALESFLLGGLYLILLAMLLYNAGIYLLSRRSYILPYLAFIICVIIVNFSQQGLNNFLFPQYDMTWLNNEGHIFIAGIYSISGVIFAAKFLDIPQTDRLSRLFCSLPIGTGVLTCLTTLFSYNIGARIAAVNVLMFGLALTVVVIRANFRKISYIRYFSFAWSLALVGYMTYALMMASLLPTNLFTVYGIIIGSTFETVFLSLAIGDKIRAELNQLLTTNQNLNQELIAKDQARTLFFQNTSHELRTPLNGIIGYLEHIKEGHTGSLSLLAHDKVSKALHLAKSLKFQVNTILDLAKAKRGELTLVAKPITLSALKREVDELAEGLAATAEDLFYESELKEDGSTYWGDPAHIITILRNLIGNAFKFRKPSGPHRVSCSWTLQAQTLTFCVKDSGIGISGDQQSRIFEEFTQLDGDARRRYEGTGLGLTMVQALVLQMGGRIELSSAPDQGSSFTIHLPTLTPRDQDMTLIEQQDSPDLLAPPTKSPLGATALVVASEPREQKAGSDIFVLDDNPYNCEIIRDILHVEGHQVRIAQRGSIALNEMRRQLPELLLLDMMMPEMSGEDVLHIMRSDPILSHVPVILVTARASDEDRLSGLNLGADDFIAKPVVAQELRIRVRNICERYRLLKEVETSMQMSKLAQLGIMFSDLSHELKNVLQGNHMIESLTTDDSGLVLNPVPLSEANSRILQDALLQPRQLHSLGDEHGVSELLVPRDEHSPIRERVRYLLLELKVSQEQRIALWHELLNLPPEYLYYLAVQLKIWSQYLYLWGQMDRCWKLTQAILGLTRESGPRACLLSQVWPHVQQMMQKQFNKYGIFVHTELLDEPLAIDASSLIQILMNLCSNAVDAQIPLPSDQRWIKITAKREGSLLIVEVENAGSPIPPEFHKKLFQRGFSTKGDQGTGIGLFVSRRLAVESGGDLVYVTTVAHPCFRLLLPAGD